MPFCNLFMGRPSYLAIIYHHVPAMWTICDSLSILRRYLINTWYWKQIVGLSHYWTASATKLSEGHFSWIEYFGKYCPCRLRRRRRWRHNWQRKEVMRKLLFLLEYPNWRNTVAFINKQKVTSQSRSACQKFYFLESRSSVKIFYFLESRK